MSKHNLFMFYGWVTLLVFPAIALLVLYLVEGDWQYIFREGWPLYYQVPLGIALGLLMGFGLKFLVNARFLREITLKYSEMIGQFGLSRQDGIFISVCAGIGEEVLFRGCIQEYAGTWITAVGFVALHGYLNPFSWRISIYGIILCALFVGIGYLRVYTGIYTCILLHIMVDLVLIDHLLSSVKYK